VRAIEPSGDLRYSLPFNMALGGAIASPRSPVAAISRAEERGRRERRRAGLADFRQVAILLLKLLLGPALVVASTLAGRRWGPGVAGVLVGLPLVAGPILFIIYLQNGAAFTADAARSSLLGLVSLAVFGVAYAHTARAFVWPPTLAIAWAAVLAADAALSTAHVSLPAAVACTLAAAVIAMALMPRAALDGPPAPSQPRAPSWDLPARAVATGALVLTVTTASTVLGPRWTGILAPFPIATSVVTAFTHAQRGPSATARTLEGVLLTLFAFPVFCVVVATLVRPFGAAAFVIAAPATVAVQLVAGRTRTVLRARRA